MPVRLISGGAPTIKSKSIAISVRYPNLSTFIFPTKAARGGNRRATGAPAAVQYDCWVAAIFIASIGEEQAASRISM